MNAFSIELQHLANRLDLPEPARTRVLLEVAGDLEAAYTDGFAGGLDEKTARERALEFCDLSDQALHDLGAVHGSALRRVLDSVHQATSRRWERGVMAILVIVLAVTAGAVVSAPNFWARGSIFAQPLALLMVAAAVLSLTRIYLLWIRQDHHPARLRRGHGLLMSLAAAMVATGSLGFWFELAWAAGRVHSQAADGIPATLGWLIRGSGLMVASLTAALLVGLVWLALERKAERCEQAALSALMEIET